MMHSRAFLALVAAAGLLAFACSAPAVPPSQTAPSAPAPGATGPSAPAAPQPLVKLKASYSTLTAAWLDLWIAKDAGFFEKYGLDVELTRIPGAQQQPALVTGDTEIGGNSFENVTSAYLGGAEPVIVAITYQALTFFIMGAPDIQSVPDLKGKAIGITSFGTISDYDARRTLLHFGMDPDKDVTIVQTRDQPTSLGALMSGAVSAYVAFVPDDLQARRAGAKVLFDGSTLNIPYSQATIVTTKGFLRENRDVVLRYIKGMVEGIKVIKTDPTYATQVYKKWTETTDDEVAAYAVEFAGKIIPRFPKPNPDGMRNALQTMASVRPEAPNVDLSAYVDSSLMEEIEKSGLEAQLYGR